MKIIKVNSATYHAIMDIALTDPDIFPDFKSVAERMEDGNWAVPLNDDMFQRLQKIRSEGESDDGAIQKLIRFYHGNGLN